MDLSDLNEQQKNAILNTFDKNCVVVAGAGSGKTKVLTSRVGYIIDDMNVQPSKIMVVTFTNKAASELKTRLSAVCDDLNEMWVGTFHSICVKILKNFGYKININSFTIMDTRDSKALLKETLKDLNMSTEKSTINKYINKISNLKNNLISKKTIRDKANTVEERELASVYEEYTKSAWRKRAFDFDDLIFYSVILLKKSSEVREWFHNNVKYILTDEMQDTNTAQFELLKLLAGNNNLYLVGDVDQSIYGFRSAKPEYLIKFQKFYPTAQVLKLERNYRSTKTIVKASNELIKNNANRIDKNSFTENKIGDPIIYHQCINAKEEGEWVANEIFMSSGQKSFNDIAILYRTNAQSRAIEDALMKFNIPYKLIGSTSFYDRKEIKDILSFVKFISNKKDVFAFKRALGVINGIGKTSIEKAIDYAKENNIDLLESVNTIKLTPRAIHAVVLFNEIVNIDKAKPSQMIKEIAIKSGILKELYDENTKESLSRVENIKELISVAKEQEQYNKNLSLQDFLNNIALSSGTDKEKENGTVSLMTIHSSKGLEFETVFIVGMEENILPHSNCTTKKDIEEERRLAYVAVTRAKNNLYLTSAQTRIETSCISVQSESRFIKEMEEYIIRV